jgi:hypothetical protein
MVTTTIIGIFDMIDKAGAKCFSPMSCILYLLPTYKHISSSSYHMFMMILDMILGFSSLAGGASGGSSTPHT